MEGKVVLGVMACPKLPLASTAAGINANKSSPEKVGCLFFGAVGTGAYVQSLNALDSPPVKVKPTQRDTMFLYVLLNVIDSLRTLSGGGK